MQIRSKNLDILFKNDYYEQRVANTMASSVEFPRLSERITSESNLETLNKVQHINLCNHFEISCHINWKIYCLQTVALRR